MSSKEDFLFEIGFEELPADNMYNFAKGLANNIATVFKDAGFSYENYLDNIYITPRRFAVIFKGLSHKQCDKSITKRGPKVDDNFDANNPSQQILGFAKSLNLSPKELTINKETLQLEYTYTEKGKTLSDMLQELLSTAFKKLFLRKKMRWGDNDFEFVRPVHWLISLYGNKVIPIELFDIKASNKSYGHRFLSPNAIAIKSPIEYKDKLQNSNVVIDFTKRKEKIKADLIAAANSLNCDFYDNCDLLTEVTALCEMPKVLIGEFNSDFLKLPFEALSTTLIHHQKCFPLENKTKKGTLTNKFLLITNMPDVNDNGIKLGFEKVITARLSDAKFFYDSDCRKQLANNLEQLKTVVFNKKLEDNKSLYAKVERVGKVLTDKFGVDYKQAQQAISLYKCDLVSSMVYEFPELQGIMGYYYAKNNGISEEIATAIKESYQPRFKDDDLPKSKLGAVVAILDKVDTLCCYYQTKQMPKGDKDPFALRRNTLGFLRIIIEHNFTLNLEELLKDNLQLLDNKKNDVCELLDFCFDRLKYWYKEQGIDSKVIDAVIANKPTSPLDLHNRVLAVNKFIEAPEALSLASANKRVSKILAKANHQYNSHINLDEKLLTQPEEINLAKIISEKEKQTMPLFKAGNYETGLSNLAELNEPIASFFDKVMVMADDEKVKINRLNLLAKIRKLFLHTADISML